MQAGTTTPMLDARFLCADGVERSGRVTSRDGMTIVISTEEDRVGLAVSGRAVAYVDIIDRLAGDGRWTGPRTFELAVRASQDKLDRLRKRFEALEAADHQRRRDLRTEARVVPETTDVLVGRDGEGEVGGWAARIANVSRSGARIVSGVPVGEGVALRVGSRRAVVVRVTDDGFAVQFRRLLPVEEFGAAVVL